MQTSAYHGRRIVIHADRNLGADQSMNRVYKCQCDRQHYSLVIFVLDVGEIRSDLVNSSHTNYVIKPENISERYHMNKFIPKYIKHTKDYRQTIHL